MPAFSDLGLKSESLLVLEELGFREPTPIQSESIPALLRGRDLIGQSKTGSGKTAAFTLPLLERVDLDFRVPFRTEERSGHRVALQALILCPTRELSTQVAQEVRKLGRRYAGLKVLPVTGGAPSHPQRVSLEHGVHVVVGTPGRVLDFLTRGTLDFSELRYIVLDEADRMLEMGFREDLDAILAGTPSDAQMLLFSATFPADIAQVSSRFQRDPHHVVIDEGDPLRDAASSGLIESFHVVTEETTKVRVLLDYLRREKPSSAIVFCNLKKTAARIADVLTTNGFPSLALHGDLEQFERDQVMAKFRNHSRKILVATDVAARGIDIHSLEVVVNFDFPTSEDVFVHRVGRTGRAGKRGVSLLLVTPRQATERLARLEATYGRAILPYDFTAEPRAMREGTDEAVAPRGSNEKESEGSAGNAIDPATDRSKSVSTDGTAPPSVGASVPPNVAPLSGHWETLQILGGRKDKLRPGDILGALTGEAGGLLGPQVGKIEIQDRHSFVAVDAKCVDQAYRGLTEGRMKGRRFRVTKL